MKRKSVVLSLFILLLCSCNVHLQNKSESVTITKVRNHSTMSLSSELGNFYVNPDLDDEFQFTETEIVNELISLSVLVGNEILEITPIYSEDIIPAFFKSLIIEPESNEWYGIDVDEVMSMELEFTSIAFYVINTNDGKSFILRADKRYFGALIEYRYPSYINPAIFAAETDIIENLYESESCTSHLSFDSINIDYLHRLFGINQDKDDIYNLKKFYWNFQVCRDNFTTIPCLSNGNETVESLLPEDMKWEQSRILGDCDHNYISASIAMSILKILCSSGYVGYLLDEFFDGISYQSDIERLSYFCQRIYDVIETARISELSCSDAGFEILQSCGFSITETSTSSAILMSHLMDGNILIVENNDESWYLLIGGQRTQTDCASFSYVFEYDKNLCVRYVININANDVYRAYYFNS